MILVDTSVWIDFFQNPESKAAATLASLIKDYNNAAICGIVLQEILQGIREQRSYDLASERLLKLPFLEADRQDWLLAASIYRKLRARGITMPPVDVTIAAIAIRNGIPLFTRDNHFETLAQHSILRLYR